MSDESPSAPPSQVRHLRPEEHLLLSALLNRTRKKGELTAQLRDCTVRDMQDGGMGSIQFQAPSDVPRRMSVTIASAEFTDEDGVPVSVVLELDQFGRLFELDIWKADFSRLIRYPDPKDLRFTTANLIS